MIKKYIPKTPIPVLVRQDNQELYHKNFAVCFNLSNTFWNKGQFCHIDLKKINITDKFTESGYSGVNNAKGFNSHWIVDVDLYKILYGITEKDIAK